MALQEHKRLYQVEGNPVMGRYMDLTKFISLLQKKALFFSRVDKMIDPFEGTVPKPQKEARVQWHLEMNEHGPLKNKLSKEEIEESIATYDHMIDNFRSLTLINCWHMNEIENALMWSAYASAHAGILVRSSFERIKGSLEQTKEIIVASKVEYVDYAVEIILDGNTYYPFIHKQRFYEYEREVRLLYVIEQSGQKHDWSKEESEFGRFIEVDVNILVEEIIVAPFAQKTFVEQIQSLCNKYEVDVPIRISDIAKH